MTQLIKNHVTLSSADGKDMQVYTAYPSGASRLPGILVFQEAFGVNAHIRDVTERIAREGYYAIAPELFHRTADKGFEGSYSDFEAIRPHLQALTTEGLSQDIMLTHRFMSRQDQVDETRTGSIGFCLGGRVSFLAACLLPLKAATTFYGGDMALLAGDRIHAITAPLLMCWGGKDAHISTDTISALLDTLDTDNRDYVNVRFSQADHAFFCDRRQSYHPASAAEAWELVKSFWKVHL